MAWQAPLCAVSIKSTNPDGSVLSQRYWAQVVQVDDPRLDRPRYQIDLIQDWALGVEPGRPTTRFLRRLQRNQERREQRQRARQAARQEDERRQNMVEAGVQTSEGDRAEAMIQTEPHTSVTLGVNDGENRRRARSSEEGEDNDRSPPYSLTRPSIRRRMEERGRVRAREH